MPNAARNGDMVIGTCPCHKTPTPWTATWVSATTVMADGQPRVNMACMAIASCGHPVAAVVGSSSVQINGSPAHRVGDAAQNCGMGVTVTGSPTVITGG